jgi:RNA polymerase sigma-70 factor (ECF subfamily)
VSADSGNPNEDPHRSAEAKEKTRDVARSLWLLPEGIRKAIYLHYWMDLRPQEIAVKLQIPTGTVKSRLHRGRKMLRNIRVRVLATGDADRQRAGRDRALPLQR